MADRIDEVINKIAPSVNAKPAGESLEGERKLIKIGTGVRAADFSEEAQRLLTTSVEHVGGKDENKQSRVQASIGKDKVGFAIIVIEMPKNYTLDTKLLAEELQRPDVKRALQELNATDQKAAEKAAAADHAIAAVQNGKTTPAAAVKVGQVGQGSQFALKVGEKGEETVRGGADYKIMQAKDGRLTALVDLGYGNPQLLKSTDTVKQQITATIDGIDGKPPKRMTFDVGKDGTLTEVKAPPATPGGNEKGTGPMR